MQLEEAVKDGFDVRGYMYWTLVDNFEWNFAFELKFVLYSYDDDEAKTRHKRKGSEVCFPADCLMGSQDRDDEYRSRNASSRPFAR